MGHGMGGPFGMQGNPLQQYFQRLIALLMQMLGGGMLGSLLGGQGGAFSPAQNPGFGGPGGGFGGSGGGFGGPGTIGRHPHATAGGMDRFLGGPTAGAPGANVGANLAGSGTAGQRLANTARGWEGRAFKPGQTKRCADFVSTMLRQSGTAPPGFRHTNLAADFAKYGQSVGRNALQPGDIVLFGNTYRRGKYTHVGIYVGNGKFAHRPTAAKPVKISSLRSGYYASRFTGGRRITR